MRREDQNKISHYRERPKSAWRSFIIAAMLCTAFSLQARASYMPFNTSVNMNVGIGTGAQQAAFVVTNGNVGIGTWTAAGGNLIIKGGGNVGIGSAWPGTALDVNGTVRMTGLTLNSGPVAGDILMTNSVGVGTWVPATSIAPGNAGVNFWSLTAGIGNVGISTTNTVGIGTTAASAGTGLVVMNGNVGIGTWVPSGLFVVGSNNSADVTIDNSGDLSSSGNLSFGGNLINISIGQIYSSGTRAFTTYFNGPGLQDLYQASNGDGSAGSGAGLAITTLGGAVSRIDGITLSSGNSALVFQTANGGISNEQMRILNNGNVGIGSTVPGQVLDVQGTVRTIGLTMSGQSPLSGYVLTAADSAGDATWSSPGTVGGWTVSGNNVYETSGGNVGIGTTYVTSGAALTVMNGNVGIGTWVPGSSLEVDSNAYGSAAILGSTTSSNEFTAGVAGENTSFGAGVIGFSSDGTGVIAASQSTGDAALQAISFGGGPLASFGTFEVDANGNVGMGTTNTAASALTVMNGNVGIGTWVPSAPLAVGANAFTVNGAGTITAVTGITTSGPYTQSGSGINSFTGNVGIGTTKPQTILSVVGGNVGIGTWTAAGGNLIVKGGGNVGIGSAWPGQLLDVQGTVRTVGFAMSGQGPVSGFVLTASDSNGDATWTAAGVSSGWTVSGANVYETGFGNVGIGTTYLTGGAALTVMNGNVGIGTWAPSKPLSVTGDMYQNGNMGIGTTSVGGAGEAALTVMNGNVGIGTWLPADPFQVNGAAQNTYINSNGNLGIGIAAPTAPLQIGLDASPDLLLGSGSATNDYMSVSGGRAMFGFDSGILTNGALALSVGTNRGIVMFVGGSNNSFLSGTLAMAIINTGNVGIGSTVPGQLLDVQGTVRAIGEIVNGNVSIGTINSGVALAVGASGGVAGAPSQALFNSWSSSVPYPQIAGEWAANNTWGIGPATNNNSPTLEIGPSSSGGVSPIGWSTSPFNLYVNGNLGIGTSTPQSGLVVMGGNVGIGTLAPIQALEVNGEIIADVQYNYPGSWGPLADTNGSLFVPAELLDGNNSPGVTGDCLTSTGLGGQVAWAPCSGGNVGIGTGSPSAPLNSVQFNDNNFFGGSSNFVFNGSNVGIGTSLSKNTLDIAGDVSIGTAYAGHRAGPSNGIIIQGSVGIGTFNPANNLSVVGGASIGATAFANTAAPANGLIVSGSVGIGTALPANSLSVVGGASIGTAAFANTAAPANGLIVSGALGIGIAAPGQAVDVLGNVRDTGEIVNGDVGIGTAAFQTALAVTNGDVGIGTWAPGAALEVNGQINETGVGGTTGALNTTANGIYSWNGGGRYIRFNTNGSYNDFESEGQPMVINYDGAQNVNFFGGGGGNGTVSIGVGPSAGARLMVYGTDNSFTNSAFNVFNSSSVSLMLVKDNGNVGIGSTAPGQLLDVQGTVRTVGFTMSGQGPVSGYVLTANDSKGDATWTSPATAGGWTVSGSNVYETGGGNVGIGTTFITGGAALTVMNGNVGIGTWAPASILTIENSAGTLNELILNNGEKGTPLAYTNAYTPTFTVNESEVNGSRPLWFGYQNAGHTLWDSYVTLGACGSFSQMCFDMGSNTSGTVINSAIVSSSSNLAIGGTNLNAGLLPGFSADDGNAVNVYFGNTGNTLIPNGNVGIGSLTPGKALDVQGTVRMTGLTLTGNSAANGNVLVSNSIGVGTWMPASTLGPIVGTNYWSLTAAAGNVGISTTNTVGIGTTFAGSGAGLVVMNGNVGIGTWAPSSALIVQGGNVGIGTAVANYKLQVGGCSNVDGTTSCVDLAELIPSSEPVSAGDIVMLDDQRSVTVKKAVSSNNNLLFGVVTTDPAIVIEGSSVGIINGSGFKLQPLKPGVALAGRIPVKVNLENGPIRVGDMITSSSVPGIGAKAVKAGRVVGIALEPMDHIKNGLYAKIIVYDDPHWWQGLEGSSEGMRSTVSALAQEVQQLRADVDALKQKVFSGR